MGEAQGAGSGQPRAVLEAKAQSAAESPGGSGCRAVGLSAAYGLGLKDLGFRVEGFGVEGFIQGLGLKGLGLSLRDLRGGGSGFKPYEQW